MPMNNNSRLDGHTVESKRNHAMKMQRTIAAAAAGLAATPLYAHPGHGNWASFAHDYEHAIWLLAAVAVAALAVAVVNKRRRAR